MSPEQVLGQEVDTRSDLFSFGTLLYEMASGRRPFQGESTVAKILEADPGVPSNTRPELARTPSSI
jgi:eukaryotic-like serine/threonine-protein kinase